MYMPSTEILDDCVVSDIAHFTLSKYVKNINCHGTHFIEQAQTEIVYFYMSEVVVAACTFKIVPLVRILFR